MPWATVILLAPVVEDLKTYSQLRQVAFNTPAHKHRIHAAALAEAGSLSHKHDSKNGHRLRKSNPQVVQHWLQQQMLWASTTCKLT